MALFLPLFLFTCFQASWPDSGHGLVLEWAASDDTGRVHEVFQVLPVEGDPHAARFDADGSPGAPTWLPAIDDVRWSSAGGGRHGLRLLGQWRAGSGEWAKLERRVWFNPLAPGPLRLPLRESWLITRPGGHRLWELQLLATWPLSLDGEN